VSTTVSVDVVEHMHRNYRGFGGRSSLYNLCKKHGITINEGYVILTTAYFEAIKKAKRRKKFMSYEPSLL